MVPILGHKKIVRGTLVWSPGEITRQGHPLTCINMHPLTCISGNSFPVLTSFVLALEQLKQDGSATLSYVPFVAKLMHK